MLASYEDVFIRLSEDCSAVLACVSMNHFKYNTVGLSGHYGLACSLELGAARGLYQTRVPSTVLFYVRNVFGQPHVSLNTSALFGSGHPKIK